MSDTFDDGRTTDGIVFDEYIQIAVRNLVEGSEYGFRRKFVE